MDQVNSRTTVRKRESLVLKSCLGDQRAVQILLHHSQALMKLWSGGMQVHWRQGTAKRVFHGDQSWGCGGGSKYPGCSIFWPGLIEMWTILSFPFPESQLIWSNPPSPSSKLTFSTSAVQWPTVPPPPALQRQPCLPFVDQGNYINLWLLTRSCCATFRGCVQCENPTYSVSFWEENTVRTWHKAVPASPSIPGAASAVIFPQLAAGFTASTCRLVTARRWLHAARFNLPVLSYIIDCQRC